MPQPKSKGTKKKPHSKGDRSSLSSHDSKADHQTSDDAVHFPRSDNFVTEAGPGCHIAHPQFSDWILGWEAVEADEFDQADVESVPDIAIDPESKTLTVCNIHSFSVVAYISVYETCLRDLHGRLLEQGTTTNDKDETSNVTTLIVLCPPETFAHLCVLDIISEGSFSDLLEQIRLESDVQPWNRHPNPSDVYHDKILAFPLQTNAEHQPAFLCTQGVHGHLTHFFSGNLHAIDFQCPIGTPLLAVADAVVVQVQDHHTCTGIAVSNLFEWNSILLQLIDTHPDKPLFVEYVHIQKAMVSVGDKVQVGQVIGTSGSVGFSPEPHLHFAAYRSDDPTAPTVQVFFAGNHDPYVPRAHAWYDANGIVDGIK